jgi:hypothetical protein
MKELVLEVSSVRPKSVPRRSKDAARKSVHVEDVIIWLSFACLTGIIGALFI